MAKGIKTGGRQKGTVNKATAELKDMILGALYDAGGREYLTKQAVENPIAFMTLLGKIIPRNINANVGLNDGLAERLKAARERLNK